MTLIQNILDTVCHALATSGPASWEGEFVMYSEGQEIGMGRQGAAEEIVTIGRLPEPFRMRIDGAPRAMLLQQFSSEFPSSITLAELALISRLNETAQLRAGQPVQRVTGTVISRPH